jgi:glycosyltransferase involved in cell wall biosynthesis
MRVLHVIDTLGRGGAERHLLMLLPELVRQGYDVALAVLRGPYDLQPELEAAGVSGIQLPKRHRWNLFARARDISVAMPDADIIHAHLYFPAVSTALARLIGLSQAHTCVTFHNLAYSGANRDGLKLRMRKALARRMYRRGMCAKLAVSEAVAKHYQEALLLDRVEVIYNPIDLRPIDSIAPVPRTPEAPLHLVLPGRLVPEKGHTDLIAALRDPRLAHLSLKVTFAGYGKLQDELRQDMSDLPFTTFITGELEHGQFLKVLSGADIVITPSRFEGFGLTALEAMSMSKPVIASTAGGLPEVLGETGRLIRVGDVAALAHAILELAEDSDLRSRLGKSARQRAETKFNLPQTTRKLVAIYEGLASD